METQDRSKKQELEMIVIEIENWLCRNNEHDKPREYFSEATLTIFGPNLVRDNYARMVRATIKYVLGERINGD